MSMIRTKTHLAPPGGGGGAGAPHAYHFEYRDLHAHRMNLIRRQDLWYQISFALSVAVLGVTTNKEGALALAPLGPLVAASVVYVADKFAILLDQYIIDLYPRIVVLEIMLDYRFFRIYLKKRLERLPPTVETRALVEACEEFDDWTDTADLQKKIERIFEGISFPRHNRLLEPLHRLSWGWIGFCVLTSVVLLCRCQ